MKKLVEERMFIKREKIRNKKRHLRKKELENDLQNRFRSKQFILTYLGDHQNKVSLKIQKELNAMEKVKLNLKTKAIKKNQFLSSLKQRINEDELKERIYLKELKEWEEEQDQAFEQKKAKKRREFLKQKQVEYDIKNKRLLNKTTT